MKYCKIFFKIIHSYSLYVLKYMMKNIRYRMKSIGYHNTGSLQDMPTMLIGDYICVSTEIQQTFETNHFACACEFHF